MTLSEMCYRAYCNAFHKGFWSDEELLGGMDMEARVSEKEYETFYNNLISTRLMLIVSEVGEAVEALREGDDDLFKEELADIAIRLGDLCGGLSINLEEEVERKMEINGGRKHKHGKAF